MNFAQKNNQTEKKNDPNQKQINAQIGLEPLNK